MSMVIGRVTHGREAAINTQSSTMHGIGSEVMAPGDERVQPGVGPGMGPGLRTGLKPRARIALLAAVSTALRTAFRTALRTAM